MEVKKVLDDDVKEACNEHDDKVKDVREQKETSLGYSLVSGKFYPRLKYIQNWYWILFHIHILFSSDGEKILALDAMALLGRDVRIYCF